MTPFLLIYCYYCEDLSICDQRYRIKLIITAMGYQTDIQREKAGWSGWEIAVAIMKTL